MTNKKSKLKQYLKNNCDLQTLKYEYQSSWLVNKPFEWLFCNGLISKAFSYDLQKQAINYAEYKHKDSDRTWSTVNDCIKEILKENRIYLTSR